MTQTISQLTISDIRSLSDLHCKVFPKSRSTKFGKPYVRKMFRWFTTYQPDLCFVAKEEKRIVGYVVGAVGGYGRKVFRYAFLQVFLGLFLHPNLWFERGTFLFWKSYSKGLCPKSKSKPTEVQLLISAALAGIGVDPHDQGKGIGKQLLHKFEDAAKSKGVNKITLSVHSENVSARSLYERCGWSVDIESKEAHTVHYIKLL